MFVATDGGCSQGYRLEILGRAYLGPLKMIMADGREAEVPRLLGMANGTVKERMYDVLERDTQESMEEGNEVGEFCWQSNCLAKFS